MSKDSRSTPDAVAVAAASLRGEGTTREEPPTERAYSQASASLLIEKSRPVISDQLRADAALGAALREALATLPPPHPLWTPFLRVSYVDVDISAPTGASTNDATRALATALRAPSPDETKP